MITRQCPETKRECQMPDERKMSARNSTGFSSQTMNNERTTVIVGDPIIKNVQAIKRAKTMGHRVVVKPFPGATICDMRLLVVPRIEKAPDQSCQHVGTNDLLPSAPKEVTDSMIIDLARKVEDACKSEIDDI